MICMLNGSISIKGKALQPGGILLQLVFQPGASYPKSQDHWTLWHLKCHSGDVLVLKSLVLGRFWATPLGNLNAQFTNLILQRSNPITNFIQLHVNRSQIT